MLRIEVKSIHQMTTSVFVFITNNYFITYDSEVYSPEGNNSVCLHYEQIHYYI